jgi:putative ABC transport system permease protein
MLERFRHAARGLRRDPILLLTASATLAVCIGANSTVFSLVRSILLRPLPFPDSSRLYWVNERMGPMQAEVSTAADYYSLREARQVFQEVGAFTPITVNWLGKEKAEQLDAALVTPSFFDTLGTRPLVGRYLARGEEGSAAPAVAVVSYTFWRGRMGSDPHAVGRTLTLDGLNYDVIGVMPQGFDYPRGTKIWRPLPVDEASQRPRSPARPMRLVNILARTGPRLTDEELQAQLPRIAAAIRAEYPKDFEAGAFLKGMRIEATPLQRRITGDLRPALLVLTGAVELVLLIACVNLANLLLARAAGRRRELAVRLALGASRGQVVGYALAESLMLAVPGGLAGVVLALVAVQGLNRWKPLVLDRYPEVVIDVAVLGFTFALTLLTGLVFGIAPALSAAGVHLHEALKSAGPQHSGSRGAARLRHALVVLELGISLVLLIGAGLLGRSFLNLSRTPLGFPADHLLTLRTNLTGAAYGSAAAHQRYYKEALAHVKQLPMVRSAAISTDLPLTVDRPYSILGAQAGGRPPVPAAQRPQMNLSIVSTDYFSTMGIPLLHGRLIANPEQERDQVIVNEALARRIFPGEDAVGRNLSDRWTIAGVVGNVRGSDLGADAPMQAYRYLGQSDSSFLSLMRVIVRTTGDPGAVARAVEGQMYAVDRSQPVFDVRTMEERVADTLAPQRFQLLLIGGFAGLAMVLAALGVYGVMACLVTRRTREIGIRIAIGARPAQVRRQVLSETLVLALIASAAGFAGAWAVTRYLASMLYGVTALDVATFGLAAVAMVSVAAAASFAPARRASQVDPMVALREE